MSQNVDFGSHGRHLLQNDSYGAAAYCFYRAILEGNPNGSPWNGIVLSLSLMRKEQDSMTMLARYGLQEQQDYDKDMVTFAIMIWQNNPKVLYEWLRAVVAFGGVSEQDKSMLTEMADDLEKAYLDLIEKHGQEALDQQGMVGLKEFAARRVELDWLLDEDIDKIFNHLKVWTEDPENALHGVRFLCMLPDPRSEKLLRRVARNEEIDPKVRTHSLLAMRWLGIRGNARISKFGESFVIDLNEPKPELTVSVPQAFKPALDRMKLWMAKQQGFVSQEEYEAHASTDEATLPEELESKVNEADIPGILQEVAHMLIRSAYDQYYPLVPTVTGTREWGAAFLMLMKDYAKGFSIEWPYGEPELTEVSAQHRNWLLSASPDFYASIEAARSQSAVQNGQA
ncbi:HEAT repeat domain-containing protein [Paenibacillus silviterrae]|uniref:HEAT repeat domain-containing protein n=1 Tax=Paenibacillus silviterrae TaxID=3242194 RepID=UPI002542915A|nr:HEAT repeat domain-containing protein [Paenibacillus chinjuensis]